ncbi:MAG: hypothetical protein AAF974_12225 [Cyanobacteria bacterium P01_E01_bin.34]
MPTVSDWDDTLSGWMTRANYSSWAQLQRNASLSRYRIQQLRQCQLNSWPLLAMQNLCTALDISLVDLLSAGNAINSLHADHPHTERTRAKRIRTDGSIGSQIESSVTASPLPSPFPDTHQQKTLQTLEPLLRQLPTAAYAVHNHNLPASHLLKVLKPLESLLEKWNVVQLGAVGEVVPFDPSWQSSLTDAELKHDTPVSIRYVGYRIGKRIWLKAQVRAET